MATRPISQSLSQAANARVSRVLKPQLAQQSQFGAHQNAVIRAFAQSLLGKLEPIAGQVGADYDQAIKQIGGLSGQAAQYLSGQNPVAAQQALTSAVGAPPEQQAQQGQALSDTFQGGAGVLAFQGGTIPGSQMAANKAAAMSQARALPAIGALAGQQSLSSALWQQGQNRQELEAQRPELVQKEEAQIQKTNLDKAAAKATAAYRSSQLDLGYAKLNQSAYDKAQDRAATVAYREAYLEHLQAGDSEDAAHNAALEAAAATRNTISAANAQTSRINAQTSRINAATSQKRAATSERRAAAYIKAQAAMAKTKKGGFSREKRLEYQGRALTLASQSFNGAPATKDHEKLEPITYAEAVLEGQKDGIPMEILLPALKRIYGTKEVAKLRAVVNALPGG